MTDTAKEFGTKLSWVIQARGLNEVSAAGEMGLAPSTIGQVCLGDYPFDVHPGVQKTIIKWMGPEIDPAFVPVRENDAREAAKSIEVTGSGVTLANWAQSVDYAKYMARATHAVSKHLRDNVGMCLAVLDLATRWDFSPFMVAIRCHVINDVLCFESQIIHAVIEKFAPLKYRLRPTYEGEGETRTCTITGHFKGELDPLSYTTPPLGKISPKNSPLWKSDPDQQLFYMATTRWGRRYCPDILFGVHTKQEMEDSDERHIGFDRAKDITPGPNLGQRLSAATADVGALPDTTLTTIDAALAEARGETITTEE